MKCDNIITIIFSIVFIPILIYLLGTLLMNYHNLETTIDNSISNLPNCKLINDDQKRNNCFNSELKYLNDVQNILKDM